ncbi:MAG TPA: hypothetical protein VIO16_06190 [Dehalococcoidia bacterium]
MVRIQVLSEGRVLRVNRPRRPRSSSRAVIRQLTDLDRRDMHVTNEHVSGPTVAVALDCDRAGFGKVVGEQQHHALR